MIELAPSILSADFAHLAAQIQAVAEGGATVLHVDVMDGHFVPNITIGPPVVASLRKVTNLPLDCHLMIENPDQYIPAFVDAGADWISVHQEACVHLNRTLDLIQSHGARAGVVINPATPVQMLEEVLDVVHHILVINPATPVQMLEEVLDVVHHILVMSVNPGFGGQKFIPSSLDKVQKLVQMRTARNANFRIEIDGGIATDTIADAVRAGVEILVAGNAVFGKGDPRENTQRLLKLATEATLLRV